MRYDDLMELASRSKSDAVFVAQRKFRNGKAIRGPQHGPVGRAISFLTIERHYYTFAGLARRLNAPVQDIIEYAVWWYGYIPRGMKVPKSIDRWWKSE